MTKRGANPRVTESVKEAIASILETEIADPRLRLVTVTDVHLTHDLSHATVYYTTVDPSLVSGDVRRSGGDRLADDETVAEGLESAAPRIRSLLGRQVRLRQTPELHFRSDPVAASAGRVEALLREVRARSGETDETHETDGAEMGPEGEEE
ncbi:MAG: 30S ribosome-binding factor RbfA [Actinobacteria bacterium]|nr:30S ribosome-binding factor RbfA [Actinomycetota bacterium]